MELEGWVLARVSGSHHIMQKDGKSVPIPVHGSRDIPKGTIAQISREAGIRL
ncbi:MAG: type II toxin-antitoxin system HicA family toxin [Acidobacteriota bacterium]|jgi:predicted RNA binding protein YcfA (HicA-like mRNA interferase family)|nr:type II toxin-antitoxin system HicA family toxin [Acidobacteriota bacterium]